MNTIAVLADGTLIGTEPDARIDPGHQWLVFTDNPTGRALASVLAAPLVPTCDGSTLRIPHNPAVDRQLTLLVDLFAHIRFTAPEFIQLTLHGEFE